MRPVEVSIVSVLVREVHCALNMVGRGALWSGKNTCAPVRRYGVQIEIAATFDCYEDYLKCIHILRASLAIDFGMLELLTVRGVTFVAFATSVLPGRSIGLTRPQHAHAL